MFNSLSLRGRLLVTPIIGLFLTLILYITSNSIIISHSALFKELRESNLPQISDISQSIALLANNQNKLASLLVSAADNLDEEQIYLQGKELLNQLHTIEGKLLKNIHTAHTEIYGYNSILDRIKLDFIQYRESSINAIELSSVEPKLAMKELIIAGDASHKLNESFLILSSHHEEVLKDTSNMLLTNTLYDHNTVTIITLVLITIMIFSALYFSNRMSFDIEKTEQELINSREEANRSNKAKSEFLSRMSHNLRTPLNSIVGFSQILEVDANKLSDDQQDSIQHILNASDHLLHLINELLDLSIIESGNMEITVDAVPVNIVVNDCVTMIETQASELDLSIINHVNKEYKVQADDHRLKQVLLNLLSNAVKYNYVQGNITIDGEVIDKQYYRISVTNTGRGLTEKEITKLFIPFKRLDTNSSIQGAGIGLVIAKNIIETMNGRIGVQSISDGKTTFWVELPLSNVTWETSNKRKKDKEIFKIIET